MRTRVKKRPRRRHRKKTQIKGRRVAIANTAISDRVPYSPPRSNYPKVITDDRRQWLPYPNQLPATISGTAAAITTQATRARVRGAMPTNYQVRFASPERVTVCIRRRRRREALFANAKVGSGVTSPTKGRKPHRTRFSKIKCD